MAREIAAPKSLWRWIAILSSYENLIRIPDIVMSDTVGKQSDKS